MAWNKDKIVNLLLEAGRLAQRFKGAMRYELKADRSIVTDADREIEGLFSRELERPDAGTFLIGEETVAAKGEEYIQRAFEGETFVVDPIDGTAPYAHLLPCWGISIGRMERGVLTDGAIYLPDMGEIVTSDGQDVLEGKLAGGGWEWRAFGERQRPAEAYGLFSITQGVAKRGKVWLPNPVLVLGAAVLPLVGLLQARFLAYLGTVKLWDVAGALPLLLRKGFSATVLPGGQRRAVTERVEEATYCLSADSKTRWALRTDLLVCHPEDEARLRSSFTCGDEEEGSRRRGAPATGPDDPD
jgi:fructose-1,6-bisphosphatase/inositol monophosphatase family enzyme